jgi:hypothetical protein
MARRSVYCRSCLQWLRFGREGGPDPDLVWLERPCARCAARTRAEREEVERLEELWRARTCELAGCGQVFTPAGQSRQKYCSDAHRKRAHRLLKAQLAS